MAVSRRADHPENTDEGRRVKVEAEKADAGNAGKVQKLVDVETEQGFRGVEVDQTPNEAYTLAGQVAGMATPETDDAAKAAAVAGQRAAEAKAAGVGGK
jgi:hypothetical protein